MQGPRPKFARPDGGEGGSHPSNVHDHVYAIGTINFTGATASSSRRIFGARKYLRRYNFSVGNPCRDMPVELMHCRGHYPTLEVS